jgi:hypothetical protein
MPGSSKWALSLRFSYQNPVYTSDLPHMCYMPHPSHSYGFDHPNRSLNSTICSFLHSPVTSSLLGPNQHSILKHPYPVFLSRCERPSFTSKHNRQNYSSLYLNPCVFG